MRHLWLDWGKASLEPFLCNLEGSTMTLAEIKAWMAAYAREHDEAGISPEQAVALCRWKLSDKVDRAGRSIEMPQFANCCETDTEEMP